MERLCRFPRPRGSKIGMAPRLGSIMMVRGSQKAFEERLKQAAIRDSTLDLEIANDWLALDQEQWQRLDGQEKATKPSKPPSA